MAMHQNFNVNDIVDKLTGFDPEIGAVVGEELARQRGGLELIASENVVSEVMGKFFITNFIDLCFFCGAESFPSSSISIAIRRPPFSSTKSA